MENETVKERLHEIKQRMDIIGWDKKHNGTRSKDHIYGELKKECSELKKELTDNEAV